MKIFILALDGLDYNLVVKWKMNNLLQTYHGKVDVSDFEQLYGHIYTPAVWAAFLTGKYHPELRRWFTYDNRLLRWIMLKLSAPNIKRMMNLLWRFGITPRVVDKRDLIDKTIFYYALKPVAVNVPVYSEPAEYHYRLRQALLNGGVKQYEIEVWRIHQERVNKTLTALNENPDYDLFMTWFALADLIGHLHIAKRPHKVFEAYSKLDNLAFTLKKLSNADVFLIVSDHGMVPASDGTGDHSNYAFYSSNIELEPKPKKITDYFNIILKLLKS